MISVRPPTRIRLMSISMGKQEPSLRRPPSRSSGGHVLRSKQAPSVARGIGEVAATAGRDDGLERLPNHLFLAVAEQFFADRLNDSTSPSSAAVTIPSATFCSTARARTSLSRSAPFRAVIDPSERLSSSACTNRSRNTVTLASSTSGRIGVKMKSTAPLAYAATSSASSDPKAVTKMIGVSPGWLCCRMSLAVWYPSMIGIRTSMRIIAKVCRCTRRRAARPDSASMTG